MTRGRARALLLGTIAFASPAASPASPPTSRIALAVELGRSDGPGSDGGVDVTWVQSRANRTFVLGSGWRDRSGSRWLVGTAATAWKPTPPWTLEAGITAGPGEHRDGRGFTYVSAELGATRRLPERPWFLGGRARYLAIDQVHGTLVRLEASRLHERTRSLWSAGWTEGVSGTLDASLGHARVERTTSRWGWKVGGAHGEARPEVAELPSAAPPDRYAELFAGIDGPLGDRARATVQVAWLEVGPTRRWTVHLGLSWSREKP